MKLGDLAAGLKLKLKNPDIDICGISSDSRAVDSGYLFAALDNGVDNGDKYIPNAIDKGAKVILCKDDSLRKKYPDITFIDAENPNKNFAQMVARFYAGQPENIAAVTGTNGKTSIADFVRQMIFASGENAASIGTLGLIKNNEPPVAYVNTTPGPITLHKDLQRLSQDGFNYLTIEASSHGICQYRVGGINIKVAGFTNLTQDHLDYHKTMENYYEAKKLLFTDIMEEGGVAVLNADIEVYGDLRKACKKAGHKVISYGHDGDDIQLLEEEPLANGQNLKISYFGKEKNIFIPLAGDFQAMNVLCALGMAGALTGKPDEMLNYVSTLKGAKGRLQYIGETEKGGAVYVDYAHTPDALENVISAMRSHTSGKLHILFGCGGDRDRTKRPIMGEIAQEMADVVYVSDDNPRTENADDIRKQVMAGCPRAYNIGDRERAIRFAMSQLEKGDVLIVAGKGHETGQYVNGKILPFNDEEVISKYL